MGKTGNDFLELRANEESKFLKTDTSDLFKVLNNIRDMVLNGEMEGLGAWIKFNELDKHLKEIMSEIKENAVEMAEQYKGQLYMGYIPEITERKTYDYSEIPEWVELDKKIKEIEQKAKSLYFVTKGEDSVNPQTGEVLQSAKVKSVSKVLTLKKNK